VSGSEDELRAALEETVSERNRLWAQLHERISQERELDDIRRQLAALEASRSWRLTAPLRSAELLAGKVARRYERWRAER
jgi:hypothetical protein